MIDNLKFVYDFVPILQFAIILIFFVLHLKGQTSRIQEADTESVERRLVGFFTIVTGFLGSFIIFHIWENLMSNNIPAVILLMLIFFLLADNWYGGYRRYNKLLYYPGHFALDVASVFIFLLAVYAVTKNSTLVVGTLYLYALHGLLWDFYYMKKIPCDTIEWFDLESSLHYASLLAIVFVIIQVIFGRLHWYTICWQSVGLILAGWVLCRIFLFVHQKKRRVSFNKVKVPGLGRKISNSLKQGREKMLIIVKYVYKKVIKKDRGKNNDA